MHQTIYVSKLGPSSSYATSSLKKANSQDSVTSDGEEELQFSEANLAGEGSDWSADNDSSSTSLIEVTDHLEIDRYDYLTNN